MMSDLKRKVLAGIFWNYVSRFGLQVVSLLPAMVLTRILSPHDYGLVAMTAVFTGIAYQLADGGFGNALVQKKEADHLDYCSVFYFNIVICFFIYILIYLIAPVCSIFFNQEELTSIIRISSLGIIFLALGQVHGIIFKKNLEYRKVTIRNLLVQVVSVILGIVLALTGYGVWALVFQGLVYTLLASVANWMISEWRPTFCFSFNRLKLLFNFGSKLLLTSLIDYGFNKSYDFVIGKFYSPTTLALYNRGYSTAGLFTDTFFGVFSKVSFPAFVQMQDNDEILKKNIRRFLIVCSMIIFFVMLSLIVVAEPLFQFLYSSKWNDVIPFFKLICIASLLYPIISILESILLAKGLSGKFLLISIVRKILITIVILTTWKHGVLSMILGTLVCRLVDVVILCYFINKVIRYSLLNLFCDLIPYFIVSLIIVTFLTVSYWGICPLVYNIQIFNEFSRSLFILIVEAIISLILFFSIYKLIPLYGYKELISLIETTMGNYKVVRFFIPFLKVKESFVYRLKFVIYFFFHYLFDKKFALLRKIRIKGNIDTVNYILKKHVSVSRFGDGEFKLLSGNDTDFQKYNPIIQAKLVEVLHSSHNNHIVCLPYAWKSLLQFKFRAFEYWGGYLMKNLETNIIPHIDFNKIYYDTNFTRFYIDYRNDKNARIILPLIKRIWNKQHVYIVEGEYSCLGVNNDLFVNAASVHRIICPSLNAFDVYDQILYKVISLVPKDALILIALGMTATCLSYDLSQKGYWAIDIGHVDIEYEWYRMKATSKVPVLNKYVAESLEKLVTNEEVNILYKEQIIATILK